MVSLCFLKAQSGKSWYDLDQDTIHNVCSKVL